MDKFQESQLAMAESVARCFSRHAVAIEPNAGLRTQVDGLRVSVKLVGKLDRQQERVRQGVGRKKQEVKEDFAWSVGEVTGVIVGMAAVKELPELRDAFRTAPSEVGRMRDLHLRQYATDVREAVEEHDAALAEFGLATEKRDAFFGYQEEFEEHFNAPRLARDERSALNEKRDEELAKLMDQVRDVLDPLMRVYQSSDADFYREYQIARRLVDLPVRSRDNSEDEETEGEVVGDSTDHEDELVAATPESVPEDSSSTATTSTSDPNRGMDAGVGESEAGTGVGASSEEAVPVGSAALEEADSGLAQ